MDDRFGGFVLIQT